MRSVELFVVVLIECMCIVGCNDRQKGEVSVSKAERLELANDFAKLVADSNLDLKGTDYDDFGFRVVEFRENLVCAMQMLSDCGADGRFMFYYLRDNAERLVNACVKTVPMQPRVMEGENVDDARSRFNVVMDLWQAMEEFERYLRKGLPDKAFDSDLEAWKEYGKWKFSISDWRGQSCRSKKSKDHPPRIIKRENNLFLKEVVTARIMRQQNIATNAIIFGVDFCKPASAYKDRPGFYSFFTPIAQRMVPIILDKPFGVLDIADLCYGRYSECVVSARFLSQTIKRELKSRTAFASRVLRLKNQIEWTYNAKFDPPVFIKGSRLRMELPKATIVYEYGDNLVVSVYSKTAEIIMREERTVDEILRYAPGVR